ncbi:MAG: hypothetical protein Q9219_000311 [cf. Caloplaca sp. 3 TL-2023]
MPNHPHLAHSQPSASEDEIAAELDEPPDDQIHFSRISPFGKYPNPVQYSMSSRLVDRRKASLLTQGLLTSPELTPSSDAEVPCLTSDGGLTSPARTNSLSPPLPASSPRRISTSTSPHLVTPAVKHYQHHPSPTVLADSPNTTDVELGLGRKRCIKFACGRQATTLPEDHRSAKSSPLNEGPSKPEELPKKPCMLKFVCPIKPSPGSSKEQQPSANTAVSTKVRSSPLTTRRSPSPPNVRSRTHAGYEPTDGTLPPSVAVKDLAPSRGWKPLIFNRPDLEGCEATRFHEFAGPHDEEDEWVNEQTAHRKKITVNDTLQKENAIRKLGEEAEEEAKEEEAEEEEAEEEAAYDRLDDINDRRSSVDSASDGGNESDDEEGFAESDNESELGSEYQFWTTGLTTAATSADQVDLFRPSAFRAPSDSSIESTIRIENSKDIPRHAARHNRKLSQTQSCKLRPGTPDLPDSTDFVCGTLDEDRPLEAAYLSCMEVRRRSQHPVIPQDIDPSFPTSDPEENEDDGGEQADNVSMAANNELQRVSNQPNDFHGAQAPSPRRPLSRRNTKSPMPSPKRIRSPPLPKRSAVRRCPAPIPSTDEGRPLASQPNIEEKSQPPTRKQSLPALTFETPQKIVVPQLSRHPNLTHTSSLPRTPNPFWAPCREWSRLSPGTTVRKSKAADSRSRGPIDIVTGLEKRRQRRKEKFWRQHYRNGCRDRDRRCPPGQGAERMRELGLEIAGKTKGQLPHMQLMLSI